MTRSIGLSRYAIITDELPDIEAFYKSIHENGGNCTEVFFTFVFNEGYKWYPFQKAGIRNEGGKTYPIYDLRFFNEEVWSKWKEIFKLCKKYSLALYIRLMDYDMVHLPGQKRLSCWWSCVQRHDPTYKPRGDRMPKFLYRNKKGAPHVKRMVNRLVYELNLSGIEWKLCPMNELNRYHAGALEFMKRKGIVKELKWWINEVLLYQEDKDRYTGKKIMKPTGLRKDQIILNAVGYDDLLLEKFGKNYLIEIHRINSPEALRKAISLAGKYGVNKFFPNGDGTDELAAGTSDGKRRQPSLFQARDMRIILKGRNLPYAFKPRHICPPGDDNYIKYAKFDILRALSEG